MFTMTTSNIVVRSLTATLGLGLLCTTACATGAVEPAEHGETSQPPTATVPAAAPKQPAGPVASVLALSRSLHDADMTEVVLDPRGTAALTLDEHGGVRLWPDVRSREAVEPVRLPVEEPNWMSLSATEDGGFVVAFIDTAGGARVARVTFDGEAVKLQTLFELPTTDPQFELHVLDGGRRVLALGIDHRMRLFDRAGTVVAAIDQPSFVPWQLRVSPRPGQAPAIVAVLAGPTRVQPIAVTDEDLRIVGQARKIDIDRGPNRNDMALSPDGTTIAALRRPKARGKRLTVEFIDLDSDARTLFVGELDTRHRPRMHWVDPDRVLLESGSGDGFWVERANAIPWTEGTTREDVEDLEPSAMPEVGLPASTSSLRVHTTVVSGIRAVPTGAELIVDPLDQAHHLEWSADLLRAQQAAIDEHGRRVAWMSGNRLVLENLGQAGAARTVELPTAAVRELKFVDDDHLVVLDGTGRVSVRGWADGAIESEAKIPIGWGIRAAGVSRADTAGQLTVAVLPRREADPIHALDVTGTRLGPVKDVPRSERSRWAQMGTRTRSTRAAAKTIGFTAADPSDVEEFVRLPDGRHVVVTEGSRPALYVVQDGRTTELELRAGQVQRIELDRTSERLAIVQQVVRDVAIADIATRSRSAVSIYDLSTGARSWTRLVDDVVDVDWSGDGARLAVAGRDGLVLDTRSGEVVSTLRHLGVTVAEVADPAVDAS